MLVTDLVEAIEDYLEITPEECAKATEPCSVQGAKSYTLPGLAKPVRREPGESFQTFAYRSFFSLIIKHGLRYMGHNEGRVTEEQLTEVIWDFVPQALDESKLKVLAVQDFDYSHNLMKKAGGGANIENAVSRAVEYVLHDFDLDTYKKLQARAVAAGRKTKYSVTQFLKTRGMTVTEAARHLGWTRHTVYAMRSYYSSVDIETGEVDE